MARKDVSVIVSGAGWIAGFAGGLVNGLRAKGATDEEIHSLVTPAGEVPMGIIVDTLMERCFRQFARDMSKEGWTLLEDAREPWPISMADLEPVPFLKEGEDYISGEEMVRRSREELHANLGQRHAEYILENQHEIPEELRKFILVFPGTILQALSDNNHVSYLVWSGGQWYLRFGWLDVVYYSGFRLLRPRVAAQCGSKVYGTFQLMLEGNATASELIQRGQYNWHNEWITDERFPLQPHDPMGRIIELVEFDHDPASEEVLAEFIRLGLERPTVEDAFYFGIQHPEEQRKLPIVFLHEPVLAPDGDRHVLILDGGPGLRELVLIPFDFRWIRNFVFAGVRKSPLALG